MHVQIVFTTFIRDYRPFVNLFGWYTQILHPFYTSNVFYTYVRCCILHYVLRMSPWPKIPIIGEMCFLSTPNLSTTIVLTLWPGERLSWFLLSKTLWVHKTFMYALCAERHIKCHNNVAEHIGAWWHIYGPVRHYRDVIMSARASKLPVSRLVAKPFAETQIKENIKAPRRRPLWVESTGGFPSQRTTNAENVSIWWRHHGGKYCKWQVQHTSRGTLQ